MIIIKEKGNCGIKVYGHANNDKKGKDIVCAAVSILTQTYQNYLIKNQIKFRTCDKSGYLEIDVEEDDTKRIEEGYRFMLLGLQMLCAAYPQNVFCMVRNKKNNMLF